MAGGEHYIEETPAFFSREGKASAYHRFPALLWDGDQWVMLINSFSKADLAEGWFRWAKYFFAENHSKNWGHIDASKIVHFINTQKVFNKTDMAMLAFAVLKNREIFTEFLHFLPSQTRKVLEHLVWNHKAKANYVKKILKVDVFDDAGQILPEMKLFQRETGYAYGYLGDRAANVEFSIPVPIRHIIAEYLDKPEGYYIKPLETVEFPSDVQLFSAEQSIFEELPRLLAHHQQGNVKYSTRGKPNLANVKRLAKSLEIREFYTDSGAFPTRANMLVGLLYTFEERRMPLEEQIKVLFQERFVWEYGKAGGNYKTHAPLYIFNFLKGTGALDVYHLNGAFNYYLVELLKKIPPGSWVTQANYARHLAYNAIPIFPFTYEGAHKLYIKRTHEMAGYEIRDDVNETNSQQLVNLPYIKGLIFVLAALGMVEIAYRPVRFEGQFGEQWFSEFDGLEAFRITRLGAYVLGNALRYEQKIEIAENKFFFDNAALILRVEGDLKLIDVLMSKFLERIAPNRYAFDMRLFLEGCMDGADILAKIESFKQAVEVPVPPLWEKRLHELLTNAGQLQPCHDWEIFRIDAEHKTLQQLIAQDPQMKILTLKAERFHVLVKKGDVKMFKQRLRELGYLC